MTRGFKISVIFVALVLELLFLALFCNPYPHGEAFDVTFRRRERIMAMSDYANKRTPEMKAKWEQELRLMHDHEDWKQYLALCLFVAINGAWIYLFWRYERKTSAA